MSQIVTYKTAVLAKEKGFRGGDHKTRYSHKNMFSQENKLYYDEVGYSPEVYLIAPLQSDVQKWLREVHNIHFCVWFNELTQKFRPEGNYPYDLFNSCDGEFNSYEEALEFSLEYALKSII